MIIWVQKIFSRLNIIPKKVILPGRWHLKHQDRDLEIFYRQLPDPGYPSSYK
tara:strand:+ start:2519 stop:2674 length:156 start_codon:yes stop_codon:yes gene_type:complete